MNTTTNLENETEFHFILNVIKEISEASKQTDDQAILDHINKTSATNMDCNHIDEIISSMLEKQVIYDKPSKKGTSYYIVEQTNDDIGHNTNNTNDYQITNIGNSQELTINTSDKDEKFTEQCFCEPAINEDITTSTDPQDKGSHNNILEDNITTLKTNMTAMKNFMRKEVFNITQKIKSVQQANCRDKVKHLREENHSKNEISKILSENISSIAISTNMQVQRREITQKLNSSNDMPCRVPPPS